MNNDLQQTIEQADRLIKQGKYKSAWNLLLPFQDDPVARKRLVWLKQNQKRRTQTVAAPESAPVPRRRSFIYLVVFLIGIFGVGFATLYSLTHQPTAPAVVTEATATVPGAVTGATATVAEAAPAGTATALPPTRVPPTEPAEEVDLQQQLRDWFMTVDGVTEVQSLDVDVPADEPPLIYAEINVLPGFNDTRIPGFFVDKLNTIFTEMRYSDFVVIVNDGALVVEYLYDPENSNWLETELANNEDPASLPS